MKEDLSIDKKSKNIKHNPKKAGDLDETYFENQRVNESTHINIKKEIQGRIIPENMKKVSLIFTTL